MREASLNPKQMAACDNVLIDNDRVFSVGSPKMCQNTDNSWFLTSKRKENHVFRRSSIEKLLCKIVESRETKSTAKYSIFEEKRKSGGSWGGG